MFTKSLLINYAGYPASLRMFIPDNGLASLAGMLFEKGHSTVIFDYAVVDIVKKLFPFEYRDRMQDILRRLNDAREPAAQDVAAFRELDACIDDIQRAKVSEIAADIVEYVKANAIDFVGFKLWVGDGFEGSMEIARQIRRACPQVYIFAGGPHVDWFGRRILEVCDAFDVLVYGDGEMAIAALAEYTLGKRELKDIPNLIYRDRGNIVSTPRATLPDLSDLPLPVYDEMVYPAMAGDQKLKVILTDDSRGCPNACSFCLHPIKSGNRWQVRQPHEVVDEMERIKKCYGVGVFRLAGSNTPRGLALGIAREILQRGLNVAYVMFANSGARFTSQDFTLLRKSGCFGAWFGIESADRSILTSVMNKKTDPDVIRQSIIAAREAGLYVTGSILMPVPGETAATKARTLEYLREVRPDSIVVEPPVVIPGTQWAEEPSRFGIKINDRNAYVDAMMRYKMRIHYPPALLQPLPGISVGGRIDRELIAEAGAFCRELEKSGIDTQITVDTALIAAYAGKDPRVLHKKSLRDFMMGEYDAIANDVSDINRSICSAPAYRARTGTPDLPLVPG